MKHSHILITHNGVTRNWFDDARAVSERDAYHVVRFIRAHFPQYAVSVESVRTMGVAA